MNNQKRILLLNYSDGFPNTLHSAFEQAGYFLDLLNPRALFEGQFPEFAPDAIVAIIESSGLEFENDLYLLGQHYGQEDIPVLALLEAALPIEVDCLDSILLNPVYPSQAIARVGSLIRLRAMQREIDLRLATLDLDFGMTFDLPPSDKKSRFNILFVGKASPEFMVIINALQSHNVNVVAAFTSFTAFEYLYEKDFDAVVINGLGTQEPAKTIIQTMRKNVKLYHVPTLLIVEQSRFSEFENLFKLGLNDIINIKSDLAEISSRIIEQANFHRLHERLKSFFDRLGGSSCVDAETNLYNRRFFESHIARLSQNAISRKSPLTLGLVKFLVPDASDWSEEVINDFYRQSATIVRGLLRMQDFVARIENNVFCLAFPDQTPQELSVVEERLKSVLEASKILNCQTGRPIIFKLEITLTNLTTGYRDSSVA